MKILFLSLSGLTFDVTTPEKQPLGGTESSFCYLARELAKTHDVTLAARGCPTETLMEVKHTNEAILADYDVVISNAPIVLTGEKKPYYVFWNHLAHFDNAIRSLLSTEVMKGIDCIVYVSEWQKNECEKWFGKAKRSVVIGNGLTPAFENMFSSPTEIMEAKDPLRAAYTSTPFRGLRMMPKIMQRINGEKPIDECLKLEVYSGMAVYQAKDEPYEGIYNSLHRPDIAHVGNVSQTELAVRLKKCSYLLYPCVFPETYCIAVLEAMAAGLFVVTTGLGALQSTMIEAGGRDTHGWLSDSRGSEEDCIDSFLMCAKDAMITPNIKKNWKWANDVFEQVQHVNRYCTWRVRAEKWRELLGSVSQ